MPRRQAPRPGFANFWRKITFSPYPFASQASRSQSSSFAWEVAAGRRFEALFLLFRGDVDAGFCLGRCFIFSLIWSTQNHQKPCFWYLKTRFFGGENLCFSWFWVLPVYTSLGLLAFFTLPQLFLGFWLRQILGKCVQVFGRYVDWTLCKCSLH